MKNEKVYLHHILDAIKQIESYTIGVSEREFFERQMVQDAVIRQPEIIEEASRQLPRAVRTRHDHIPWDAIIGMRNRIAHEYLDIDLEIVWEVGTEDLPRLKTHLQDLIESIERYSWTSPFTLRSNSLP